MFMHSAASLPADNWFATIIGEPTQAAMQRIGYAAGVPVNEHRNLIRAYRIATDRWAVVIFNRENHPPEKSQ